MILFHGDGDDDVDDDGGAGRVMVDRDPGGPDDECDDGDSTVHTGIKQNSSRNKQRRTPQ